MIIRIIEKEWDEASHPRTAAGSPEGGQFTSTGGTPKTPRVGDTLPGGGKVQPGDLGLTGWKAVPEDQKAMVRENWAKDYAERHIGDPLYAGMNTAQIADEGRIKFDNEVSDQDKLDHFNRMDADEFVKPPEKPLAPGLPTSQLGKEPRVGMPEGGTTPDQNEEAQRIQDFRAGRGEPPSEADLQRWRDRGWIAPDAKFEPAEPSEPSEPEQEEYSKEPTPEDEGPTPEPESWDELNDDQQEAAKQAWVEANKDAWIADEINAWREDDSNFEDIPEQLSNDESWNEETIKDINDGYYPGEKVEGIDDSGGGTPEQHAEEAQRIAEWKNRFDSEESYNNGAFVVDNVTGKLEVDTDKLVFRDNPYEGADAERQQMLPGVSREEMSNAWKKAQWAKVDDDFQQMYKEKFDEEVEKRTESAKENPPDWIYDNAEENMVEVGWDQMNDDEKFHQAQQHLSDLGSPKASPHEDKVRGNIEPSEEDVAAQKKIRGLTPKGSKFLGGGISTTKVVTMNDGSKYVWKPSSGEVAAGQQMPAGTQYAREVAAYDISTVVGMKGMVPVSTIMRHENQWGAMMSMIPNAHNDGTKGNTSFSEDAKKAAFFDYIIGNVDRHENNWMSDKDGKLWLIDHGRSFSDTGRQPGQSGLYSVFAHDLKDGDRTKIPATVKRSWKDKWDKIEAIMQRRGMTEGSIEGTKNRYEKAMAEGSRWGDLW